MGIEIATVPSAVHNICDFCRQSREATTGERTLVLFLKDDFLENVCEQILTYSDSPNNHGQSCLYHGHFLLKYDVFGTHLLATSTLWLYHITLTINIAYITKKWSRHHYFVPKIYTTLMIHSKWLHLTQFGERYHGQINSSILFLQFLFTMFKCEMI